MCGPLPHFSNVVASKAISMEMKAVVTLPIWGNLSAYVYVHYDFDPQNLSFSDFYLLPQRTQHIRNGDISRPAKRFFKRH